MEASLSTTASNAEDDPVFVALHATIDACGLPLAPFQRLLRAFRSDVLFRAPQTWDEVIAYCSDSADPVGELMLRLDAEGGEPSPAAIRASDAICTALQITNFLQDLGVDRERGRSYLPVSDAEAVQRTAQLFNEGSAVLGHIHSWRLRMEVRAIIAGGRTMLALCAERTDRSHRPALSWRSALRLIVAFFAADLRSTPSTHRQA
jgi:phytoene/squalene synthetase